MIFEIPALHLSLFFCVLKNCLSQPGLPSLFSDLWAPEKTSSLSVTQIDEKNYKGSYTDCSNSCQLITTV